MTTAGFFDREPALLLPKLTAVLISLVLLAGCCAMDKAMSTSPEDDKIMVVYPAEKQ